MFLDSRGFVAATTSFWMKARDKYGEVINLRERFQPFSFIE
jgi:hypothetical protein